MGQLVEHKVRGSGVLDVGGNINYDKIREDQGGQNRYRSSHKQIERQLCTVIELQHDFKGTSSRTNNYGSSGIHGS